MYNNCDCSSGFGSSCPAASRELRVDALSSGEWSYIRGLFLADGYSYTLVRGSSTSYTIGFLFTGGKEEELACKVVELLKRAGLNPFKWKHSRKNMIVLSVNSKALLYFLPDKEALKRSVSEGKTFLVENELFSVRCGIPFIAGLIDGDGYARVHMNYKDSLFGSVVSQWGFAQTVFPFLIDFLRRYVNGLTRNGATVGYVNAGCTGRVVWVSERGREALLSRGIAEYSWKVQRWMRKVERLERELLDLKSRFHSPFETAKELRNLVSPSTVVRWCRSGYVKHILIRGSRQSKYYSHLIPVEEVRRLESELRRSGEEKARMRSTGKWLGVGEAARILGVDVRTLSSDCGRGIVRAVSFSTVGGKKRYLIPVDEVDRLMVKRGGGAN